MMSCGVKKRPKKLVPHFEHTRQVPGRWLTFNHDGRSEVTVVCNFFMLLSSKGTLPTVLSQTVELFIKNVLEKAERNRKCL